MKLMVSSDEVASEGQPGGGWGVGEDNGVDPKQICNNMSRQVHWIGWMVVWARDMAAGF